MNPINFVVDQAKCVRCRACVADCPSGVIQEQDGLPFIPAELESGCIKCQHCLAVCPSGAVSVLGCRPENSLKLQDNSFPGAASIDLFIRGRRSVRQFKKENLDRNFIDKLLHTAAHAPTGCNARALRFDVVYRREDLHVLLEKIISILEKTDPGDHPMLNHLVQAAADYRRNGTDEVFRGAPHLLIVSPTPEAVCAKEDVVIALSYFEMIAQCSGVGTTWCGYLFLLASFIPEIKALLGFAPDQYFYAMLFGKGLVKYHRTVQRDGAAEIHEFKLK